MGQVTTKKRICSIFLAVLMAFTGILPASAVFADDGVKPYWDLRLYYKDTDTAVPDYQEDGETPYIEYMIEGEELNLSYKLIDAQIPDNGYIKWYSETPSLVDVTQEGVVKAFDSSKGAVIQSWIDNEVKTIPLIGGLMATIIEKALFNDTIDVDSMDTDAIVTVIEGLFSGDSALGKWADSYKEKLIESLRKYLDSINSNIHVQLYDGDDNLLADDYVQICVNKNDEWYANFLPNGTHITNKSLINTTVAVGTTTQLYAVTTPLRLKYGVVYSVKNSSIFDKGKVIATVDDSGLVTFKNTGTVTIMVSPDTEQIINNILELINYIYKLENTGTINTDKLADILIKYVGLDMNRTVLKAILDACFVIKDVAGGSMDKIQLTATAIEILSNLILQFAYNDTITFNVIEAQPITDFNISGANTVQEGSQIQLSITDVKPTTGDTSDITWSSSDPSIASVDPVTGVITGRDAGGRGGSLSTQQCTIYATSAANNVTRPFTLTVKGKVGEYLSDLEIQGASYVELNEETDYTYKVYPDRIAKSSLLKMTWGMQTGTDENGSPVYTWLDGNEETVTDGIGLIDKNGHYTAVGGGNCIIALKGKILTSTLITTFEVSNGVPISYIDLYAEKTIDTDADFTDAFVGEISRQDVEFDGEMHHFVTDTIGIGTAYATHGVRISATIDPDNASNKNLVWHIDNTEDFELKKKDNYTVDVVIKAAKEKGATTDVWCTSEDGRTKSTVMSVTVTRNNAKSNVINNKDNISVVNYKQANVSHSMEFNGSWTSDSYACKGANWYSSDESIFTVQSDGSSDGNAVITGVDVGVATLYCVSTDGGIMDNCQVTVYPNKDRLREIVELCDSTFIERTDNNIEIYSDYMRSLDLAYYVLYDEDMASQAVCDNTANDLLYAFYIVGGFIGIEGVEIIDKDNKPLENKHITVKVGNLSNYKNQSYDFNYKLDPVSAMYSEIVWKSSNRSIKVDENGVCTPVDNKACTAMITCTVVDYMGVERSDSVYISFVKNAATGVTVEPNNIPEGKIGTSQNLKATVLPKGTLGVGDADCKDVYWSSSDESVATVDSDGKVSFVDNGSCVITCTTYDGGFTAQCEVNSVTNYDALELLVKQHDDMQLNYVNYYPDTWNKYNSALEKAKDMLAQRNSVQAEVDSVIPEIEEAYNGLVKYNYVQRIELYHDGEETKEFYQYDLSVLSEGFNYKNAILDLNIRVYPNNGSYESVVWESSTADITVDEEGRCYPTSNKACYGSIKVTMTDHFGNVFTDSVWVSYAFVPVTGITISNDSINGGINETYQLGCTVLPAKSIIPPVIPANIQEHYWESDDESVATVDQNGLVTFVSAGTTTIRVVSYDGGYFAECAVSCNGDRSALRKALDDYKDVVYTDYEYDYGMAFKNAYDNAQNTYNDGSCSQSDLDAAAAQLNEAYSNLAEHPFIKVDTIAVDWKSYQKKTFGSDENVDSGTVNDSDAVSINVSKNYATFIYNDYIVLTANPTPEGAMYKSAEWTLVASNEMKMSPDKNSANIITLTPTNVLNKGGWATVEFKITDQYDRTYTRTIHVVMSRNTVTGFDIAEEELSMLATDAGTQLNYTVSGSAEFADVVWSSSDENVAAVDQNGYVTPVNIGTAVITGKTFDGGYADTVTVTVLSDFSALIAKRNEYYNFIEALEPYTYTQESLDVLSSAIVNADEMINARTATQDEVDHMVEVLDNAFNSLVKYVKATGISISFEEGEKVSSPNAGFIRYEDSLSINNKSVTLIPVAYPENSIYTSIKWESSNPNNISVDSNGVVTSKSASNHVAKIICTIENVFGETAESSVYVSFTRSGVAKISLDNDLVYGMPGKTASLSPKITNSSNSSLNVIKDCIYTSSDETIATVNENGVVTFVSQGEATITVTALDGGFSAEATAYTTWDTTALAAAIEDTKSIVYTDYAYSYGMAFKDAYDNAQAVYANIRASQEEIDLACHNLIEAAAALDGNAFILPEVTVLNNDEAVESGAYIQTDDSNTAVLDIALNDGAMVKSVDISTSNENGVSAQINGRQIVLTKLNETGSITVTVKTVDDYDREIVESYDFTVMEKIIVATSISLTANGELVTGNLTYSAGGKYANFSGVQLGYAPTPENANSIVSVKYEIPSLTEKASFQISDSGFLELTSAAKRDLISSNKSVTVNCTVTNLDGSTATSTVKVTVTRK